MRPLTSKERWLSVVFGGLIFLAGNLFFLKWAGNQIQERRKSLVELKELLAETQQLAAEKDFWEARKSWMEKNPPEAYRGPESDSQFAETVQQSIIGKGLTIQSQDLRAAEKRDALTVATIDLTLEGGLEPMVRWLYETQQPGRYSVFETLALRQAEAGNKMTLQAKLRKVFLSGKKATP